MSKKIKLRYWLTLAVFASLQAGVSSAQSLDTNLDEIIVTAQRRSEAIERTPVAVTALNAEALERQAIKTEADLQSAVPGLLAKAVTGGNQLTYTIRGQSLDADTNSQPAVKPYFNEVPVPGLTTSSFYDLESIQVLKGPQGTLFGRNVTGGAVLYTPTSPKDEFGGFITARAGNYNEHGVDGAINIPLDNVHASIRIAGSFERRDGFTDNLFNGSRLGDVDRDSVRASFLWSPVDAFKNTLVFEHDKEGGSGIPAVVYSVYGLGQTHNGIPLTTTSAFLFSPALDTLAGPGVWNAYLAIHPAADPNGLSAYAALQNSRGPYQVSLDTTPSQDSKNNFVSNTTSWELDNHTKLKNIAGYVNSDLTQAADQDGTPFLIQSATYAVRQIQYSDEFQVLGDISNGEFSYVAGIFYVNESNRTYDVASFVDLSPIIPVSVADYNSDLKDNALAGYAQGTLGLERFTGLQGLGLTAGFRYTREHNEIDQLPGSVLYDLTGLSNTSDSTTKKPSWLVTLEEQLNAKLLLYITARESFRSGGFNIFSAPIPGTSAQGGNGFNPEVARDVELGSKFRGELGTVPIRANIAIYQENVKDVQRSLFAINPVTSQLNGFTANVPEAQIKGVEIDAKANLTRWLEVGLNAAYTNARFTENTAEVFGVETRYGPYSDSPRWSGSVYIQVAKSLPDNFGTLTLRADSFTQSSFSFSSLGNTSVPETELPGYTTSNIRIGLENIAGSRVSVAAYVRNLANRVYFVGGLPTGGSLGYNEAVPGDRRTVFGEVNYKF